MRKPLEINPESGKRLKQAIKHAKTTQSNLASATYTSQQTISKIINGAAPLTLDKAQIFAQFLNVRWQYLACQDAFMTDRDRFRTMVGITSDIQTACYTLIAALGYEIVSMKELDDGSHVSMHRPYKDIRIRSGAPEDEIISLVDVTPEVRIYQIKGPDGHIAEVEDQEFIRLWQDIESFVRFKCEAHFERPYLGRYSHRKDRGF